MFTNIINLFNSLKTLGFDLKYDNTGEHMYFDNLRLTMSVYLCAAGTLDVLSTNGDGEEENKTFSIHDAGKALLFIIDLKKNNCIA